MQLKRKCDEETRTKIWKKRKTVHHLNTDVIVCILSFLSAKEICHFSLISKTWHIASKSNFLWEQVFQSRFEFMPPQAIDKRQLFLDQYKDASIKMRKKEIEIDGINVNNLSHFENNAWKKLSFSEKFAKIIEYYENFKKHFLEDNDKETFIFASLTMILIDRIQSDVTFPMNDMHIPFDILKCLCMIGKGHVAHCYGYTSAAKSILSESISKFNQLSQIGIHLDNYFSLLVTGYADLASITYLLEQYDECIMYCEMGLKQLQDCKDAPDWINSIKVHYLYLSVICELNLKMYEEAAQHIKEIMDLLKSVGGSKKNEEISIAMNACLYKIENLQKNAFDEVLDELESLGVQIPDDGHFNF